MSPRSRGVGPFTGFLLLVLGIAALGAAWTALNYRGGLADDEDLGDRDKATATVEECERVGPVSLSGIGYWWDCRVAVSEEDGDSYSQNFRGSQFTPDDAADTVPLANAGRGSQTWTRADVPSNNMALFAAIGGVVAGAACVVSGVRGLRGG